jgi:trigger factor
MRSYVQTLLAQGIHPQTLDVNWDDFQQRQREQAVQDVKAALVLDYIAEKENVTATDEEVELEIAEMAQDAHQTAEAVRSRLTKEGGIDRIKDRIRNRKSLDLLLSLATVKQPQGIILQT